VYDAVGDLYENNSTPGADFATGGSASASCIYGAGYEASKAFDDSNATAWVGAPGVTAGWIQYDLGDGNSDTLAKCTITARSTYANGSPKDFTIQGSNNGTDWDTLKTVTGETGWTPNEKREFVVDDDTAYRYFRIDIATVDGASNMNIAEIEFIDAAVLYDMTLISENFSADYTGGEIQTSEFPMSGVASASSEASETFAASKAFDDNVGTTWRSDSLPYGWLQYDLGSGVSKKLYKVKIQADASLSQCSPKDFTIQGSNNDSDWDTLKTVTGETGWTSNEVREFVANSSTAYRYFRIDVTDTEYGSGYLMICEVELHQNDSTVVFPTAASLVSLIKPPASFSLTDDIKAWVTQDDGASWEQTTLVLAGDYGGDVKIYTTTHDFINTGGVEMCWKITSHNNKAFEIHGVSLSWR
jgi:hypothetical protein